MNDTPLTPRQQLLAAAAIGALALAGSIGAMNAGRGLCMPGADAVSRGAPIGPIVVDQGPEPEPPRPIVPGPR